MQVLKRQYLPFRNMAIGLTKHRKPRTAVDSYDYNNCLPNYGIPTSFLRNPTFQHGQKSSSRRDRCIPTSIIQTEIQATKTQLWRPTISEPPLFCILTQHQLYGGHPTSIHPTQSNSKIIAITIHFSQGCHPYSLQLTKTNQTLNEPDPLCGLCSTTSDSHPNFFVKFTTRLLLITTSIALQTA